MLIGRLTAGHHLFMQRTSRGEKRLHTTSTTRHHSVTTHRPAVWGFLLNWSPPVPMASPAQGSLTEKEMRLRKGFLFAFMSSTHSMAPGWSIYTATLTAYSQRGPLAGCKQLSALQRPGPATLWGLSQPARGSRFKPYSSS